MRLGDLLMGIEIKKMTADSGTEIGDIRYDSRRVAPGDLFVAIKGFESDGHEYIQQALDSGAAAILCTEPQEESVPYIMVENSRAALAIASGNFFGHPASRMKLVGVTGTNGKTTVTMLIKHVIETTTGSKVGLIGTNGNLIGDLALETEHTTPESYELQSLLRDMAEAGCEYAVMEVSSHALMLNRVAGIEFEVAVFTNLTQDHLDFHDTMEEYAKCKAILFRMCKRGCINIDDDYAEYIMSGATCEILTYSTLKNEAELVAKDIKISVDNVKFCAVSTGIIERVTLHIPGLFSVYNALSVISACSSLGIASADIAAALFEAPGILGRMEVVPVPGDYTVLIDYAHTPDAIENILSAVREVPHGRIVLLFGCGGDRDKTKRPLMGKAAAEGADFLIVTSDNPRTEEPGAIIEDIIAGVRGAKTPYVVIEDRRQAIAYAIDNALSGDIIILAGKGHETYQIVGKTKAPMDERLIVTEHLGLF